VRRRFVGAREFSGVYVKINYHRNSNIRIVKMVNLFYIVLGAWFVFDSAFFGSALTCDIDVPITFRHNGDCVSANGNPMCRFNDGTITRAYCRIGGRCSFVETTFQRKTGRCLVNLGGVGYKCIWSRFTSLRRHSDCRLA
jgi:hypothetical protein